MAVKNRLRRDNYIRILEALWLNPGRSRADLARELRLDRSTVGVLVDNLIDTGIISQKAVCTVSQKGGRPPVRLSIVPGFAYSIGVELTYPHIRLNAVDLCGDFLGELTIPVTSYGPQAINTLAVEAARFRATLDKSFSGGAGLVTLGVGVSGHVDNEGRSITLSYALHINHPLSVAEPLETVLQVPIMLLNDAQAAVLREAGLRHKPNILLGLVEIRPGNSEEDYGIGAGLVIGGELIHGRAITHLLRPNSPIPTNSDNYICDLGRSLALVCNVTGIDEIVLGGDVDNLIEPLGEAIQLFTKSNDDHVAGPILVSRAAGGSNFIASGAAYSAMKFLFSNLSFPLPVSLSEK